MLKDFDEFCMKNNLQYNVAYGNVIGKIRHDGFIPWDDDIDVNMPISDYITLNKIWKKAANTHKYFLQTHITNPNIPWLFYRIRMNNTCSMDISGKEIKAHWGLPLDIFPMLNAPKNANLRKIQHNLL